MRDGGLGVSSLRFFYLQGMPAEYERYLEDPAYAIINVPPNFMFKAKIFKPSRLCAIFKTV
jgi:hypothetical protein